VDVYFEKVLLPALPSGSVIMLENARFHQSPTTQSLAETAGCRLLFLPSHSFLSPICPMLLLITIDDYVRREDASVHREAGNFRRRSLTASFVFGRGESTSPLPFPQRGEGEEIYSSTGTTKLSMM
jgi:hypothetical protein